MIRNVSSTNSAVVYAVKKNSYEIKVGKTIYSVKHKWDKADLPDLISDYIAGKIQRVNAVNAA